MNERKASPKPSKEVRSTRSTYRFLNFAEEYSELTKAAIGEIAFAYDGPIHKVCQYHLGLIDAAGQASEVSRLGKLVRSALALVGCWAVGGEPRGAVGWGAILELIHSATLIHDDLEDADRERRGQLAVWVRYGKSAAILSGNAMMKVAHCRLRSFANSGLDAETYRYLQQLMTNVQIQITAGQHLDLSFEARDSVTYQQYIEMVELKTSALLSFAFYSGAIIGLGERPPPDMWRTLQELGSAWGRLFQIQDDIIGIWGDAAIGKPLYSDIVQNKKTLPLLHLTQHTDAASRNEARQVLRSDAADQERISAVLALLERTGTEDYCRRESQRQFDMSLACIQRLSLDAERRELLTSVSDFLYARVF